MRSLAFCVLGSCNTIRWEEYSASDRTLGGRDTLQRLSWQFCSTGFVCRYSCRERDLSAIDRWWFMFRCGRLCGIRCGTSGQGRGLGSPQFSRLRGLAGRFFLHFRFSFCVDLNPENRLSGYQLSALLG